MAAAAKRPDKALAEAVAGVTGVALSDPDLLRRALTHASARGASPTDYQRLEFLGDRVLALAVAEMLFAAHPEAPEGELSRRLASLVNAQTLAEIADDIGLPDLIRAGSDVRRKGGAGRVNLHADVMEALIAAIYLDSGIDSARQFIRRFWGARADAPTAARRDAKTELQEWAHQQTQAAPLYTVENREGPDHDPVFAVSVVVPGFAPGLGEGRSKREAERAAAASVLVREGVWSDREDGE